MKKRRERDTEQTNQVMRKITISTIILLLQMQQMQ